MARHPNGGGRSPRPGRPGRWGRGAGRGGGRHSHHHRRNDTGHASAPAPHGVTAAGGGNNGNQCAGTRGGTDAESLLEAVSTLAGQVDTIGHCLGLASRPPINVKVDVDAKIREGLDGVAAMQSAMSQLQSFMNSSRSTLERLARQREREARASAAAAAAAADEADEDGDECAGKSPDGGVPPVRVSTGSVLPVADSNAAAEDAARSEPGPAVVTPSSSAPGGSARQGEEEEADPSTLEGALALHSSYLTSDGVGADDSGSLPLAYASWLRNAVGIETVQGLVDALDACSDLLTDGDGSVGILPGLAGRFRDALAEGMFDEYSVDGYGSGGEGDEEDGEGGTAPDPDGAVVDWHGRGGTASAADPPARDPPESGQGAPEAEGVEVRYEDYEDYDEPASSTGSRAAGEPPAYCYYRDQSAPPPGSLQSASSGVVPSFLQDRSDPPSLDDVVDGHAHLLAGPPSSYAAWLREEMDIETLDDLAEAVDDGECLEVLSAGDGAGAAILAGCEGRFAEAVRYAAGRPVGAGDGDDAAPCHSAMEPEPVMTFPQGFPAPEDADVTTLEGIVAGHAHFLTGPAEAYESFLRSEMDITSPSDLVEALVEDIEAMAAGDGTVGVQRGSEEVFRDSIVQCVFSSSNENEAALARQREADESRAEAERLERQKEIVLQKQRELELKLEAERVEAERIAGEEAEAARQAEKRRKKEEKKRRKREADEAKARLVAEKEEEERREAEAEKKKRIDLKRQKQLAMAAHSEQTVHTRDAAASAAGASASSSDEQARGHDPEQSAMTTATAPSRPSAPLLSSQTNSILRGGGNKAKAAFANLGDRLSVFIAGPPSDGADVSPIFALLQDESTVRRGRELLQLECLAREQAGVVDRMVRHQNAERKKLQEMIQKAENERTKWEGKKKDPKDAKKGKDSKKDAKKGKDSKKDDKKEEGRREKIAKQIKNTEKQIKELIGQNVASSKHDVEKRENFFKRYKWHDAQRAEVAAELASLQELAERGPDDVSRIESLMRGIEARSDEASSIKQRSEASSSGFLGGLFDRDARKLKSLEAQTVADEASVKELQEAVGIYPASLDGLGAAWKKRSRAVGERVRALQEELPKKEKELVDLKNDFASSLKGAQADREEHRMELEQLRERFVMQLKQGEERLRDLDGSIKSQEKAIESFEKKIAVEEEELVAIDDDIMQLKGERSDKKFDINNTRDSRGMTFLQVAAQNNDVGTAMLCLEFNADCSVTNKDGLTAVDYSSFFSFDAVTRLLTSKGAAVSSKYHDIFSGVEKMSPIDTDMDWDEVLRVSETAAVPSETFLENPQSCELDEAKRMPRLTEQERSAVEPCFEGRLIDPNINPEQVRRVALLSQSVYNWCLTQTKSDMGRFAKVIEGLKPTSPNRTTVHRRAEVGTTIKFEVLAAGLDGSDSGEVVLFTPFVSGEVDGVSSIGVVVWEVSKDDCSSMYKTLISNTEFLRNKVEMGDTFLPHKEGVLELGKDMHLLDLRSTSIWTTSTLDLFAVNVDNGDLHRLQDQGLALKKRIVHSEMLVNRAIFQLSEDEARESEGIFQSSSQNKSTLISGGAGTGKTLLLIKKVAQEDPSMRILVVSRLPRLVSIIKTSTEEKREGDVENVHFSTYDELMQLMARRVIPDHKADARSFGRFDQVRFDCDEGSGVSFLRVFFESHLSSHERDLLQRSSIQPLTLWHAIIVIKSTAQCVNTKRHLEQHEYFQLPISFGLTLEQRKVCFDFYLKYEEWRSDAGYYDESDRSMYILRHGPSVFREDIFVSWTDTFDQAGVVDKSGNPLFPFFYDMVCCDESQDFTEMDMALFVRMSRSIRSVFMCADPAQSVELGISLRSSTVNDVLYSQLADSRVNVKQCLQTFALRTNHRTHEQNLAMGQAIRRVLARSFKVTMTDESALIVGKLPKTLRVKKLKDLANPGVFKGGNVVFVSPDEVVHELRLRFSELGIKNDIFGTTEAKGLEFDCVALLNFFTSFDEAGSSGPWQNALRWLSSKSALTRSEPTNEKVAGVTLESCDYTLTYPQLSDQAMALYTAITRARNQLYFMEVEDFGRGKKRKAGVPLADYALRRLSDLKLTKPVTSVDEGALEMSSAQHKARGVLLVTQAISMSRRSELFSSVAKKLQDAIERFSPANGNDYALERLANRSLQCLSDKNFLIAFLREKFFGGKKMEGLFLDVLHFQEKLANFFETYGNDSFVKFEVAEIVNLVQEVFSDTPYWSSFEEVCANVQHLHEPISRASKPPKKNNETPAPAPTAKRPSQTKERSPAGVSQPNSSNENRPSKAASETARVASPPLNPQVATFTPGGVGMAAAAASIAPSQVKSSTPLPQPNTSSENRPSTAASETARVASPPLNPQVATFTPGGAGMAASIAASQVKASTPLNAESIRTNPQVAASFVPSANASNFVPQQLTRPVPILPSGGSAPNPLYAAALASIGRSGNQLNPAARELTKPATSFESAPSGTHEGGGQRYPANKGANEPHPYMSSQPQQGRTGGLGYSGGNQYSRDSQFSAPHNRAVYYNQSEPVPPVRGGRGEQYTNQHYGSSYDSFPGHPGTRGYDGHGGAAHPPRGGGYPGSSASPNHGQGYDYYDQSGNSDSYPGYEPSNYGPPHHNGRGYEPPAAPTHGHVGHSGFAHPPSRGNGYHGSSGSPNHGQGYEYYDGY